jgi:hypothetical protein
MGLYGYCGNADPNKLGIGVYGRAAQPALPNNYAARFDGNVGIIGTLTASFKSAVVPFPDGTHRVLHCMESRSIGSRISARQNSSAGARWSSSMRTSPR